MGKYDLTKTNTNIMTNKERNIVKRQILKCLTVDFKGNQAIFDKNSGTQTFFDTDLSMVMNAVVKGLEFAKEKINTPIDVTPGDVANEFVVWDGEADNGR